MKYIGAGIGTAGIAIGAAVASHVPGIDMRELSAMVVMSTAAIWGFCAVATYWEN